MKRWQPRNLLRKFTEWMAPRILRCSGISDSHVRFQCCRSRVSAVSIRVRPTTSVVAVVRKAESTYLTSLPDV